MASFERVRHVRRGVSFDAALRTLAIANLRVSLFDFDGAVTGLPAQPMRLEQVTRLPAAQPTRDSRELTSDRAGPADARLE